MKTYAGGVGGGGRRPGGVRFEGKALYFCRGVERGVVLFCFVFLFFVFCFCFCFLLLFFFFNPVGGWFL